MEIKNIQKRVIAEIDLNALEYNLNKAPKPVCCVIKADAYGHGAVEVAKFLESKNVNYFAVSNIEEAIELRNNNIKTPILILGYTPVECAKELNEYNINQCVFSYEFACKLNEEAKKNNINVDVHIKIDTGMGRIGFQYHDKHDELQEALASCKLSNLNVVGIFTHFAKSDENINEYTEYQYECFTKAYKYLESQGIKFKIKHCANSAAILDYPDYKLDMVREGIMLYGVNPTPNKHDLKHVMTLKSYISHIKVLNKGDHVSYSCLYEAENDVKIATVPIGYADGISRENTGLHVMINNKKCKIVGRVCMDQIMVEVKDANIGDEVIVYGDGISVEEVANYNHTNAYKVLCDVSRRVPRVYKYNGKIVAIRDELVK